MNRYQKVIAVIAVANIFVMLLFPPFLDNPMAWGMPRSFEGFHFFFLAPATSPIHTELLAHEIIFVLTNALAAWLALNRGPDAGFVLTGAGAARGIALFGIANGALIALFPPFEPYSSMVWALPGGEGFDGFHFAFGDKMYRDLCLPMLYLEVIMVTANLLAVWLMFGNARRRLSAADERLLDIVHNLAPQDREALANTLRREIESSERASPDHVERMGRHDGRRHQEAPDFKDSERRSQADRRKPG
ncbi:MAG: hypothetical protein Q8O34_14660 [Rhodocyclaceae bacterium]|nr:hypothetical protein [Rhodocyclaceae bacterium]